MKRLFCLLLALCLSLSAAACGRAPEPPVTAAVTESAVPVEKAPFERAVDYLLASEGAKDLPGLYAALASHAGESVPDWIVIALARTGRTEGMEVYEKALTEAVLRRYETENKLSRSLATEWHRIGLCFLAMGKDPRDVGGVDLAADGIWDRGKTAPLTSQGCNGVAWALTFLGAGGFPVPDGATQSREELIGLLLEAQHEDGGWVFGNFDSDADTTGMALTGLSFFRDDGRVDEAVEKGLALLAEKQLPDGGYESFGSHNPMSISQVILGLTHLGIDPLEDERFRKEGGDMLSALLAYQLPDGGFAANDKDTKPGGISTCQAMLALAALELAERGEKLFDMEVARP
ncbi:MAG: terpene cyclase/mutase family protein [Clostridia bacterium]|nr:terpene cyclase/mutase family protein [Clostridia bacterium]